MSVTQVAKTIYLHFVGLFNIRCGRDRWRCEEKLHLVNQLFRGRSMSSIPKPRFTNSGPHFTRVRETST